ncbi:MAG: hypothetical protein SCH66_02275 [Methanolobus sp.]|nr:hypothetical protein [Methanolobus sp.]
MGWFDVVAGIATGGLYTAGKAIYQAGNAAEDAGNAAEEAGLAIAVIGSTIESVGEQLVSTLKEAEELLTVRRLTPRSEADLWDEEKARLDSLKQEKTSILNELKNLGVNDPSNFSFNFWDMVNDMQDIIKQFQLMARLAAVNKEIHDIYYQEPGVLSTGIYNAKEVLERFNTVEQPMVEDILASVDDNLEVSEEVLQEVKKLFVTKKKVPVSVDELSPSIRDQLETIRLDKLYYKQLLTRKDILTSSLANVIKVYPENVFEIGVDSIRVPKENIYDAEILEDIFEMDSILDEVINEGNVTDAVTNPGGIIDEATNPGNVHDGITTPGSIHESETNVGNVHDTGIETIVDSAIIKEKESIPGTIANTGAAAGRNATVRIMAAEDPTLRIADTQNSRVETDMAVRTASAVRSARAGTAKTHMTMMQPHGARISASLSTKFDGYQRNYDLLKAQKAFYHRQTLKLDKRYELLSNEWVDEPGVVPKTLDELHGVLSNLRTEEQPRIDMFLDTLNTNIPQTLNELNGVLGTFRTEEQPRIDILLDSLSTNIPQTLDGLNGVLQNVRTEEQPRIDLILDNVNANLEESKQTLSKANDTMESVQNALSILDFDTKYVKIGAMAIGGLVVLDLFVGLIVLIRMALGI